MSNFVSSESSTSSNCGKKKFLFRQQTCPEITVSSFSDINFKQFH